MCRTLILEVYKNIFNLHYCTVCSETSLVRRRGINGRRSNYYKNGVRLLGPLERKYVTDLGDLAGAGLEP